MWPSPSRLFATPYQSLQVSLRALGEGEWLKVLRVPAYTPRQRRTTDPAQEALFALPAVGALSHGETAVGRGSC